MSINLCCRVKLIRDPAPGRFTTEAHKYIRQSMTQFLHTMTIKAEKHLTIINKQLKMHKDKESPVEISNS